jgi:membrane protein YdbS with pleckstrin-like domain
MHRLRAPGDFCINGANRMSTILIVLLVLLLVGALPTWPYSTGWGYYPSSGLGLVVVVVLVLVLLGRI